MSICDNCKEQILKRIDEIIKIDNETIKRKSAASLNDHGMIAAMASRNTLTLVKAMLQQQ